MRHLNIKTGKEATKAPTTGAVMTVTGPINPDAVGMTLMHEHIFSRQFEVNWRWDAAGLVDDEDLMASELQRFIADGGKTVVELSLNEIGRDPVRLKKMSERIGLQIVMGCGWYRQPYYPAHAYIDRRTVDHLAEELIREIEQGVGDTGIQPGIIGEIGVDKTWISAQEERVHRAAARAHLATGLSITTHALKCNVGLAELDLFEEEGVDLTHVIIGHADSYPILDYYLSILDRGAILGFDGISGDNEGMLRHILKITADLIRRGYAGQIVLSHDVCKEPHMSAWGGRGYSFVTSRFLPALQELGVGKDSIEAMMIGNPRKLLTRTQEFAGRQKTI